MNKILFVCQGNVARSQMAEAYYNYFTKSDNAFSAGISKTAPSKYEHPVKEVIQVMKEDEIDVSQKVVKFITKEMVASADKIFVMCQKEECPEFLLNSGRINFWNVEDPYDTDLSNFRRIRDEIKEKVRQLIENK